MADMYLTQISEEDANCLSHHGIKGMRWGVRRWQNADGSLTTAGRKRYGIVGGASGHKSLFKKKVTANADVKKTSDVPTVKKKKLSEMTDDEVREAIARAKLEEEYRSHYKEPVKEDSKAKIFLKNYSDTLVKNFANSAADSTSKFLTKKLNDALGLTEQKTDLQKLKDEFDRLDYKRKINDLKKDRSDYDKLNDEYERKNLEKKIRDLERGDDEYEKLKKEYDIKRTKRDIRELDDTDAQKLKRASDMAAWQTNIDKFNSAHVDDRDYEEWLRRNARVKHSAISEDGEYLIHYGIKGMKWGVRRYQNEDGTLTEAGKKRISKLEGKIVKKEKKRESLAKSVERQTAKYVAKSGKMYAKAAKLRRKEFGMFTSQDKAADLEYRAKKLEAQADMLVSKINLTKSKIEKVDALISKYNRKIAQIDPTRADAGREFIEKNYVMRHSDDVDEFLAHHGILGMKWGVRRYQNEDGTLTEAGKKRYNKLEKKAGLAQKQINSHNYSLSNKDKEIAAEQAKIETLTKKMDAMTADSVDMADFKPDEWGSPAAEMRIGDQHGVAVTVTSGEMNEKTAKAVKDFLKDFDVDKQREGLAKEFYDKMEEDGQLDDWAYSLSRDQFKKQLKLYALHIDPEWGTYYAMWDDPKLTSHSLDIEGSIKDHKARHYSMNG